MEHDWILLSLPAVVALGFKLVLMLYAGYSTIRTRQTRLFLLLLFVLAIHNVTEIMVFYRGQDGVPVFDAFAYFAVAVVALAVFVHLALSLALDREPPDRPPRYGWVLLGLYAYATVLEALLLGTDLLIAGFAPLGYSYYRIPGPLYRLFELYAVGAFVAVVGLLLHGALRHASRMRRLQCQYLLLGTTPMALLVIANVVLMHYGSNWLNTPVTFPIAATFFLAVTTYAVHQHRLFDIQFFIPWSKLRKRKTAFHDRIRAMIAEVADLASVNQAVERLAQTLRCPVALLGGPRPVLAAEGAQHMVELPLERLRDIEHIVVRNEIAESRPETSALMRRHGIAAIVPFYPHSQNASGWLLLGDSFSEEVYTPLDFRLVEELFDRMGELFLDQLLAMRARLVESRQQLGALEHRLQTQGAELAALRERLETLTRENARLLREQPADGFAAATARARTKAAVTLLGRDKEMLERLRARFPQLEHFAGPASASFRRQPPADLLVCALPSASTALERRLLAALTGERRPRAALLYGESAGDFAAERSQALRAVPTEVLAADASDEALVRKTQALIELGSALHAVADDWPLLGRSPAFEALIAEAKRVGGLPDPVCVRGDDPHEALALGAYLHAQSGRGAFIPVRMRPGEVPVEADLRARIGEARGGTLMIEHPQAVPEALWNEVRGAAQEGRLRLVASAARGADPQERMAPLRALVLDLPSLAERRADLPLLAHYFTLRFNLQTRAARYLTRAGLDALLAEAFPRDLAALRSAIYARLVAGTEGEAALPDVELTGQGRSLDDYVAEFEARLIEQTLRRCGGNKSKAARLLGLRPNTLHYKLERYGLSRRKR